MTIFSATWKSNRDPVHSGDARVKLVGAVDGQLMAVLDFAEDAPKLVEGDVVHATAIPNTPDRYYRCLGSAYCSAGIAVRCAAVSIQAP